MVDSLKPAFTPARAQGDRAGINFISHAVDLLEPVTTAQGKAVPEVPKLVALVSSKTGLSQAAVLQTLQTNFPHTLALLQAIPLSAVTAELPGFVDFVAAQLKMTSAQVLDLLKTSFPRPSSCPAGATIRAVGS